MHKMPGAFAISIWPLACPNRRAVAISSFSPQTSRPRPCARAITLSCSSQDKFHQLRTCYHQSVCGRQGRHADATHSNFANPCPITLAQGARYAGRVCRRKDRTTATLSQLFRFSALSCCAGTKSQAVRPHACRSCRTTDLTALFPKDSSATVRLSAEAHGLRARAWSIRGHRASDGGRRLLPTETDGIVLSRARGLRHVQPICTKWQNCARRQNHDMRPQKLRSSHVQHHSGRRVGVFRVDDIDFAKVCDRDESGAPVLTPLSPQNLWHEISRACIPPMCSRDALHLAPTLYFFEQFFRGSSFSAVFKTLCPCHRQGQPG